MSSPSKLVGCHRWPLLDLRQFALSTEPDKERMMDWNTEQKGPGLWLLAGSKEKITSYAVVGIGGKLLVIDPTWSAPSAMMSDLSVIGCGVEDLSGILFTHAHADFYHFGMWFRQYTDCWIALHSADSERLAAAISTGSARTRAEAWLTAAGVSDDELQSLLGAVPDSVFVRQPPSVAIPETPLPAGNCALLEPWKIEVVRTPGHTPGHVCLYDRENGRIFTGHHILPRTTPNVSKNHHSTDDPLGDYLDSLSRLRGLVPREVTVFPGREQLFQNLPRRIDELRRHHEARLAETLSVVEVGRGTQTVWDVAKNLTWSRPWDATTGFMRRAALGEAGAHLAHLEKQGLTTRTGEGPDRWATASPPDR